MIILRTERFKARFFTADDDQYLRALVRDRAAMQLAIPGDPFDENSHQTRTKRILDHIQKFGYGFALYFLKGVPESLETLRGFCGLFHRDTNITDHAELGYWVHPDHFGEGIGQEIAAAALAWGKHHFKCPYEVVASVHEPNAASIRILQKIGMKPTATVVEDGHTFLRFGITLK